jgi:signal transduction histidine kinase
MKIRVTVKDCNLKESVRNAIRDNCIHEEKCETQDACELAHSAIITIYNTACSKYIKYGEYITVEFDLSGKEPPRLI